VDGTQWISDVLPENCRCRTMCEPAHCCGATSKSGFLKVQASSCAQFPSNPLKLPGPTGYHLTTWYKFMVDNAFPIKKHNQHHLDLCATHCVFFLVETLSQSTTTASWCQHHTNKPTCLLSVMTFLRKISLPFAFESSS
jgi:hypothetical protein